MKSTDFRKLKPTYEGDTKEAKKSKGDYCRHCGSKNEKEPLTESEQIKIEEEKTKKILDEYENKAEGSTSTGTVGAANFVYSDVKEAEKQNQ